MSGGGTRRSGLERLQAEVAALLMEPARLGRFAEGPRAYARRAGLRGSHADLLAGLPAEGLRYFAERRRIDRAAHLRADLPRSLPLLEREAGLGAYFAAHPYALEAPVREAARLARWAGEAARRGTLPRFVADALQVEAAAVRLWRAPHRAASPGRRPRRAPGVRLLRVAHDPTPLLHGRPWTPRPGHHTVVLQRTADDVETPALRPVEVDALRAADGRRTRAQVVAFLARQGHPRAKAAAALERLRRQRLVL